MKWQGITIHEEVIDDPSQHEGRIRSFKHERGNWSTIVYVDCMLIRKKKNLYWLIGKFSIFYSDHASDELKSWMQLAAETINIGNIKTFDEYHISLSRTVILKFHWIDSFVDALKQIVVKFENFLVELSNLKVYCNEEKTRTFLGIEVRANDETMEQLTKAVDTLLSEYNLPAFYEVIVFYFYIKIVNLIMLVKKIYRKCKKSYLQTGFRHLHIT